MSDKRRPIWQPILVSLLLTSLVAGKCRAGDSQWIRLFDGETLDGWSATVKGDVKAEEGEIRILSKANLWLLHETTFDNFELIVEAKMPDDAYNSGIGFRCTRTDRKTRGYQCEVARAESGMIYAIGSGWVWPKEAQQRKQFASDSKNSFDNANWNTFRIRCEGDRIRIWINDKQVTDVHDDRFESGSIALQHHGKGGVHRFRNVRIRELDGVDQSSTVDQESK